MRRFLITVDDDTIEFDIMVALMNYGISCDLDEVNIEEEN